MNNNKNTNSRMHNILTAKEALKITLEYPVNETVRLVCQALDSVQYHASNGNSKCVIDIGKRFSNEVMNELRKLGYSVNISYIHSPSVEIEISWENANKEEDEK